MMPKDSIAMSQTASVPRIVLRHAKRLVRRVINRVVPQPPGRHENPYATHIPALVGLGRLLELERVIELGCGQYSSLTLLDRAAFPRLAVLDSYDTDREWLEKVREMSGDARVSLHHVDGAMAEAVPSLDLASCDLIFIDDSLTVEERSATIRSVTAARSSNPRLVAVVHDFENVEYREAASGFAHVFAFTSLNPNTGVMWDEAPLDPARLRRIDDLVRRHSRRLQPDGVGEWLRVFETELR